MLPNNLFALLLTFVIAIAWLRLMDLFAHKGWVSAKLSRKIIHIGTGPIFVLCWLLFNESPSSRYLAAVVPLLITIQFVLVGFGVIRDQASVDAMSRSGNRKEILKGPVFYGIAFIILTVVYWKNSIIGILALMLLCGGDGLADVMGNRFGKRTIPWSPKKTILGSFAMFFGGLFFSLAILGIFELAGVFPSQSMLNLPRIALICFIATIVESLRFSDIDNITVPAVAVLCAHLLSL
jgi:phytol kinase